MCKEVPYSSRLPALALICHLRNVYEGPGQVNPRVVFMVLMCTSGCMCVCSVLAHVVPMSLCVLYACTYETIVCTAHMCGSMKARAYGCVFPQLP